MLELDESHFEKVILKAVADKFNKIIYKLSEFILDDTRLIVRDAITSSPEYSAILGQTSLSLDLQAHFGLIAPSAIVNDIIYNIIDAIEVDVKKFKISTISSSGGLSLRILRGDFSEVLSSKGASYYSKHYLIDWLRWLLFEGTNDVVVGYDISFGNFPQSRSKKAVMIKTSSSWNVPSQFSGTQSDNWLTRAISKVEDKIAGNIEINLRKMLV